jgi:N6-adenosine-specific RNA methylase IME4
VVDPARAVPELATVVMNREINVKEGAQIAETLSKEQQREIYQATRNGKPSFKTMAGNAINAERAKRLSQSCAQLPVLLAQVVHIDAPWAADQESPFNYRDICSYYPVMSDAEIQAILRRVLAPDVWVFMWTTVPLRKRTEKVLENLNCESVAEIVWKKIIRDRHRRGLGRVVRYTHETLLVYRRGNPPLPPTNSVPDSVIEAEIEEHSKKPDVFRDIIIAMTPNLEPRLELFARGTPYPGFIAWGNEVTQPGEDRAAA